MTLLDAFYQVEELDELNESLEDYLAHQPRTLPVWETLPTHLL